MNLCKYIKWGKQNVGKIKRRSILTSVIVSLAIMITVPTIALAVPPPEIYYGEVNNVDWMGYGTLDWWVDEGVVYFTGEAYTEADEVIDYLWVQTEGCVYCGGTFKWLTRWSKENDYEDTWIVGEWGGPGEITAGACSWYIFYPVTALFNDGEHKVEDGVDDDEGETQNGEYLP